MLALFDPRSVILVVQNGDQFRSAKALLEQDEKQWENIQNQHACLPTSQAMLWSELRQQEASRPYLNPQIIYVTKGAHMFSWAYFWGKYIN